MTLKTKSWLFFALLLIVFVISGYWLVKSGNATSVVEASSAAAIVGDSDWSLFLHAVEQNIAEPFAIMLLQLIAILIAVRIVGFLFVKIGQPTVIGEIIAGIILGPSLLGYFFPDVFNFLFPDDSMRNLEILSQIGLIFFMFVIGMELELDEIKKKANETFIISQTSIIVPFFFGMLLAYFVYQNYAVQHTTFLPFALFIGISMSITAFPVLARIVQEKSLTKTHLGVVAIASAASNDVTAWCLLAVVIAIAKTGTIFSALSTIGLSIAYVLFMLLVVRPFLQKLGHIYQNKEVVNKNIVAFIFLVLILSASATQIIGIHALFGAFLAGVIMPVNLNFRKILTEKIEDLTLVLLLPLFFVFTGLRTKIGLLNTPELWALCAVFIVVGIAGKLIGTAAAARINGESWHSSLSLGALMNARGLMELIVLNIGYEMNILPPTIFVILVLMALITTFMTTPTLNLLNRIFPVPEKWEDTYAIRRKKYKILLSFGRPESGPTLLAVVRALFGNSNEDIEVTALHMTVGSDVNPILVERYSQEGFNPILREAKRLQMPVRPEYRITDNAGQEIVDITNADKYDFLLVGAGLSIMKQDLFKRNWQIKPRSPWLAGLLRKIGNSFFLYPGNLLNDKTRVFIEQTKSSVGIFIDHGFKSISNMLVLLYLPEDVQLLQCAQTVLENNPEARSVILDVNGLITKNPAVIKYIRYFSDRFENRVTLLHKKRVSVDILTKQDFMLISYASWDAVSSEYKNTMEKIPSTLIIREKQPAFTRKA